MNTADTLSPRQISRSMNNLIAAVSSWCLYSAAATGSLLIGLFLSIGLSKEQIGFAMSLTMIFLPLQIVGSWLQPRFFHRKHFWEACGTVHLLCFFLIALLAGFWFRLPGKIAVPLFLTLFAIAHAGAQLPGAVTLAWQGEIIPQRDSNDFWTRRAGISMISSLLAGLLFGYAADVLGRDSNRTYAILLGIGLAFGYLPSLIFQARVPDLHPKEQEAPAVGRLLKEIWAEKNFRILVIFFSIQSFSNWLMCGFNFMYLQKTMNFTQTTIQVLLLVSNVVGFFSAYLFRFFGNRYGRKPLLLICTGLKVCEFLLWGTLLAGNGKIDLAVLNLLQTAGLPTGFIPAAFISTIPIMLLGGFVNMGLGAGQLSLLTSIGKKGNQSMMIGLLFTIVGLTSAVSSNLSGFLYEWLEHSPLPAWMGLTSFNLLVLLGACGYFCSLFFLREFQEFGAAPTVRVIKNLLAHNPFRTIYHAYVLNTPLSEARKADVIRDAAGDLVGGQMAKAIYSPSEIVRASALWSLAHHNDRLDDDLETVLIAQMGEPRLGLRQLAVSILAKHCSEKALPHLIKGFQSPNIDFANACLYAAEHYRTAPLAEPLRAVLNDSSRQECWSAAAEAISRAGNHVDAPLVMKAYENEPHPVLSLQCLLSLCRIMLPRHNELQEVFDAEYGTPGRSCDLLLERLERLLRRPDFHGIQNEHFSNRRYPDIAADTIRGELTLLGVPPAVADAFFAGKNVLPGTCPDYVAVSLRLQFRLWGYLYYEGADPDHMKLLAVLILARQTLENLTANTSR